MKKEALFLILLAFLALGVRAAMWSRVEMVQPDEAYFIWMGQHLAEGKSVGEFQVMERGFKGQLSFPRVFGFITRSSMDPVAACQWVSILLGVLTLLPFHSCVRSFASLTDALWADLFYALSPITIQYSLWAMPHSLFNVCLVLLVFFALRGLKSGRSIWMGLAGFAAAGAYLARVEGILLAAAFFVTALIFRWFRRRNLFIFAAAFAIGSFPYWFWLHQETGIWQLTWSEGRGVSGIYVDFISKLIRNPSLSALANFYFRNFYGGYLLLPKILPLVFWVLAGSGAIRILRRGPQEVRALGMVIFFSAFPLFLYPLLEAVEARFLSPTVLFLFMLAGAGIPFLPEAGPGRRRLVTGILFILAWGSFLPGTVSLWKSFREDAMEQKKLGEWVLAEHGRNPKVLFGSDSRLCFYARSACKRFVGMRQAVEAQKTGEDLAPFLEKQGVDFIAMDTRYVPKFYPSLQSLLADPPKEWRPLKELSERGEKIILYEWEKPVPRPTGNG